MARWITITKAPFDYPWPGRAAITAFTENGEFFVKEEVADFAVEKGYATEGQAEGSKTKSSKGGNRKARTRTSTTKKATTRAVTAKKAADAGTNLGTDKGVGGSRLAADDSAGAGKPLADSAE